MSDGTAFQPPPPSRNREEGSDHPPSIPSPTPAAELARLNQALREELAALKQVEEKLREDERRLRAIIDTEPECVKIVAANGTLLLMNPAGLAMIEADSPEAVLGRSVYPLVAPQYRDAFRALIGEGSRGGKGTLQFEIVGLKGTRRWLETHSAPLRNERGEIVGVLGITRDISERKRAEEALRESEDRYRRLVEMIPDTIFINRGGRIVFVNSAGVRFFGAASADQILGRSPLDFIHPDFHSLVKERIRQVLETMEPAPVIEEKFIRLDGSVADVEVTAVPFPIGGETAIYVVLRDVTERKQVAEELRQTQKMEAVGKLAGGIAHDFNNLLTIILGHSQLMLDTLERGSALAGGLSAIQSAGERAALLTSQLLAFSRRQILQPRLLDLNQIVEDMDTMLRPLIGEQITLVTEAARGLWPIKGDGSQIEQIIMNLAVNARDAMPQGGTLTIATANVTLDGAASRRHTGAAPGAYVMLSVKDTGVGMDEETQARVFEPFFTTKEPGKGTGLGLSTVYGIVRQSDGFIQADSAPGQGAVFTIYFPRAPEDVRTAGRDPAARRPAGSETILLAEDEPTLRALVRTMLQRCGYTVLEAKDGQEALRICREHEGAIDLLMSDVVMPGMNGSELAERATALRPKLRVLLVSGYTDDVICRHGILEKGIPFLQKPYAPDLLAQKIRDILEG